jgi:hypothetical protein
MRSGKGFLDIPESIILHDLVLSTVSNASKTRKCGEDEGGALLRDISASFYSNTTNNEARGRGQPCKRACIEQIMPTNRSLLLHGFNEGFKDFKSVTSLN